MVHMQPNKSIWNNECLMAIQGAQQYPLVAAVSTKRPTKQEKQERQQKQENKKNKVETVFTVFPKHYCRNFHLAIARLRYFDGVGDLPKHKYCNLYEGNGKGKFLERDENGEK